jgi:hypothetical protein
LPQRTGLGTARHDQDDSYQKILRLAACFGAPTSGVSPKGVLKDAMKFEFMVDDITSTAVVVGHAGMSPVDVHVGRLGLTFMEKLRADDPARRPIRWDHPHALSQRNLFIAAVFGLIWTV